MVPAKILEHLPPSLPAETTGKIEMWTVDRGNPLAVTQGHGGLCSTNCKMIPKIGRRIALEVLVLVKPAHSISRPCRPGNPAQLQLGYAANLRPPALHEKDAGKELRRSFPVQKIVAARI